MLVASVDPSHNLSRTRARDLLLVLMNIGAAISSGFSKYATFRGRASRSEFWWWALFGWLAVMAGAIIDGALGTKAGPGSGLVGGLVSLALFLPGLAISVRRLHDIDKSGWWYLIVFTIIGLIPLFIWSCLRGTDGTNRFGPDPIGGSFNSPLPGSGFQHFDRTGQS